MDQKDYDDLLATPQFTMTKEEATALYKELEHSFITYDSLVVPLIIRLAIFVKQHELVENKEINP